MTTDTTDYLLDTNACIGIREIIKGSAPKNPAKVDQLRKLKARWSNVPKERLFMSIITWGELRYGAEKSDNPSAAKARLEAVRQKAAERTLKIELDDEAFARVYGHLSHPVPATKGRKLAVRVVSQFGEESTKVLTL